MNKKTLSTAGLLIAAALVLAGCTTDDGGTDDADGSEISAEAQAALDKAYEGVGSHLDDLAAVSPEDDVNLYIVSCGESTTGCSQPAAAVKEAGEAIGWTATIADGKLSPEGFATAIRQAVAGGADVIVPIGIGCAVAQAAFQEAVDAGVTIIGGGGVDDCDPQLWASERLWLEGYTPTQQWNEFGALQADYVFGKTDGDVKALVLNFTGQVWGQWITDGFNAELDALGGGEVIDTVDINDPEVADGSFVQKVTTALLNAPDANVLIVPIDGWLVSGLAQAIVQSGRDADLLVIARGGDEPVMDMIRAGDSGVDATIGFATQWGGWGSVDTAARVLAGEEPVYIGESMQAVDAETNMVDSGPYLGSADFKAAFTEAWGK